MALHSSALRNALAFPPPTLPTDGIWTAIDANTATWSFKSVKQDIFGPANYTDNLTIKKAALRRGE